MNKDNVAKIQRSFEDWALTLETNWQNGKTLMTTAASAKLCRKMAALCKELNKQ